MPSITLAAGQISDPIEVGPGTRVVATNGYVQWTTGSMVDARNGVATWQTWPAGAVAATEDTLRRVVIRGVATGAMTLSWDESKQDEGADGAYWQEQVATWATDPNGNAVGMVGPDGRMQPVAVDWGGLRVYDDFSGPVAPLIGRRAPTGQVWGAGGPGGAAATAGAGRIDASQNVYPNISYGGQIPYIGGTFSFVGGGTRTATGCTLIASQPTGDGLQTMIHLTIAPSRWVLTKRVNGGSFDPMIGVSSGTLALATNGAQYHVGFQIDKATGAVTVMLPDGTEVVTGADPAVAAMDLTQGIFQLFNPAGAVECYWNSVAMGERRPSASRPAVLGGVASAQEVAELRGAGLTQKQVWQGTFAGTGWHRILTRGSWGTFVIAGTLTISHRDGTIGQLLRVDVSGAWNATPVLTERLHRWVSGRKVSQIRMSRDAGSFDLVVDINVVNDFAGQFFTVEWEGVGDLVGPPTSGANALPTESVVLTLS